MNKQDFLEKLRKRISILKDEEIDDIITEYGGYIDEKVKKKKKTEEDAIKEFGDFDELVSEILSAYKIDEEKSRNNNSVMGFFDEIGSAFEKFIKEVSQKDFSEIMKLLIEIFLIILVIGICHFPFSILIEMGESIFAALPSAVYSITYGIWRFILEVIYVILAVILFVKIFQARYLNKLSNDIVDNIVTEDKKNRKNREGNLKEEKRSEIIKEKRKNNISEDIKENRTKNHDDSIVRLLMGILRFFVGIFIMLPGFFVMLGMAIALSFGIGLFIAGVNYIGFLLCIIAMFALAIMFFKLLFNFVFDRRAKLTGFFVSLVINICLLGAGLGIASLEIADSTYINDIPSGYEKKTITEEFNSTDIDYVSYWYNIEFITEDALVDKIRVEIDYYKDFANPDIEVMNRDINIDMYRRTTYSGKKIFDLIKNDLKNREFHNYSELFEPSVRVYAKSDVLKRIKDDYRSYEYHRIQEQLEECQSDATEWRDKYYDLYSNRQNEVVE